MFVRTTAINKILNLKKRKKVVQGGTSAGKTYAIIPVLIDRAAKTPRLKITIVAETVPAVKDGAVDIFKQVMFDTGRWRESGWIANPMEYTFANKSRIQFKAFDSEGKAKAAGKRDILFINEGNHVTFKIADALMIRSKETYIDFNPDNEFWAHTEVLTEPNSEFLSLTYQDNEAIPLETLEDLLIKKSKAFYNPNLPATKLFEKDNIKSTYWANWWRVYGLGEIGNLQGVVFENWKIVKDLPRDKDCNIEAKLVAYFMDFGFTNDPTAFGAVYKHNGELYIDELIYQTRLTNNDIGDKLKSLGIKEETIIGDSAEPKSIQEIYEQGFNIYPAEKGPDSIKNGIDILLRYQMNITERSLNIIKEFRSYKWDEDKDGKPINKPIDYNNHAIDGIRYVALNKLATNNEGSYSISVL